MEYHIAFIQKEIKMYSSFSMTDAHINHYDNFGYCVIENAMSSENCDILQNIAETKADENHSVILNLQRFVPIFHDLMAHSIMKESLLALKKVPAVCGINSQYLFKKAGTPYAKQAWTPHQDNSYPMSVKGSYIVVHLSLEDSDPDNGGLIFWPGSHVEDILDFEHNKSWREDFREDGIARPGQTVQVPSKYSSQDMYLKKGSLCYMHGNLIHGSHPNLSSTRNRPQYSMCYLNKGDSFLPGVSCGREVFDI